MKSRIINKTEKKAVKEIYPQLFEGKYSGDVCLYLNSNEYIIVSSLADSPCSNEVCLKVYEASVNPYVSTSMLLFDGEVVLSNN